MASAFASPRRLIICILLLLLLVACSQDEPAPSTATTAPAGEQALASVTPPATATTAAPTATPPSLPTPTAAADDPAPTPTQTPMIAGLDPADPAAYGLYLSYTAEDPDTPPPAGGQWLLLVATIDNQSNREILVEAASVTLITDAGTRLQPEPPDEQTQPPLVGIVLAPGENFLGILRFALPNGETAAQLTWCPTGGADCPNPLLVDVP